VGAAISVVNFAIHAVITALIVLATRHAARVLGTAAKATGTAAKATGLAKTDLRDVQSRAGHSTFVTVPS